MGWAVGRFEGRDIGYGVPAVCDYPGCGTPIDRGLGYVCGYGRPYGDPDGCGRFFCEVHGGGGLCERCERGEPPFEPTADTAEWITHKLTDPSWSRWRHQHPAQVRRLQEALRGA